MSWNDVVGSVAITMYNPKSQTRWRLIDNRGVDLAPGTKHFEIKAHPYQGTLAYLRNGRDAQPCRASLQLVLRSRTALRGLITPAHRLAGHEAGAAAGGEARVATQVTDSSTRE